MSQEWDLVPLGEILQERKEIPSDEALLSGKIRIIEKIGFNEGKVQLRVSGQTKTGMILIRPGDLVISGINATKGAIAIYPESQSESIAATIHYGAYIPNKDKVEIKYLWWLLRSKTFKDLLLEYVPGGIKTELKAKRLLPVPIPLPPIDEQRRIVAKVEAIAVKIEEARGLRVSAIKEISLLSSSSLKDLMSGFSIDGTLFDVLLDKPRNGWSARCDNLPQGTPVLSLGSVTGFRYRQTEYKRTSEFISPNAHYWLKKNDLLITRSNTPELIGHVAIYNGHPFPCIYPDLIMRLEIDETKADKYFVHHWLSSPLSRDYIISNAKGTSPTMKKISQGTVMNIPFPTGLGLSEQRRIVEYLDSLQTKIDEMKRTRQKALRELDAMLPSILDRAFKGEL